MYFIIFVPLKFKLIDMRIIAWIAFTGIILVASGCTGGKNLQTASAVEDAFRSGDYRTALENSETIIRLAEEKGRQSEGQVYTIAGISAYEIEEYNKSLKYLEQARGLDHRDEGLYWYLAMNYRRIDNLSKEITALETYASLFPEGENIRDVRRRLLRTCIESENYQMAEEIWTLMDSTSREDLENLETWLLLNQGQENESLCDSLSSVILQKDPENESALRWTAESHFWKAENSYQYQMRAYKQNRTRNQYTILLKAFEQVNIDFRKSRDYFLKLYEMNPDPKYARFLGNIFTRLEDRSKADYYKKLAN
jgi:hypothetical protein